MKRIFFYLLLALVAFASSCKKRGFPLPAESCNISRITVTVNGSPDTTIYDLSYDPAGLPTSITSGTTTQSFTYGNSSLVEVAVDGGTTVTDSVTLGSTGLMTVDVNRISSTSPNYLVTDYFYSGSEVVNASLFYNGVPPGPGDFYEYTWNNGNLQNFVPQGGLTTTTSSSYTYNSEPAAVGDYWYITQLLGAPAPTVRTANQVIEVMQNVNSSVIIYARNPGGRITGMTMINSSLLGGLPPDTVNYAYQFQCELIRPPLAEGK